MTRGNHSAIAGRRVVATGGPAELVDRVFALRCRVGEHPETREPLIGRERRGPRVREWRDW